MKNRSKSAQLINRRGGNNQYNNTINKLHKATESGDISQVLIELERGSYINSRDINGETPLHIAVKNKDKEMVRALLSVNGIDVNAKDRTLRTPIWYAPQSDNNNNDNNNNNNKLNNNKPKTYLYWLDYLGCSQSVPYGAHGYGATFIISILDRYYNNNMTPQEAIDLLQKCIDEVKKRVIISTPHFISRVITRDGVQLLEHCH
eukprot:Tbor_TRINITY_DN6024_c2_g1::TRINITY_DN6024_c2_g1_i2::g.10415::m.10415/K02734/PSMB2; 20S proteasome subunit beta 4